MSEPWQHAAWRAQERLFESEDEEREREGEVAVKRISEQQNAVLDALVVLGGKRLVSEISAALDASEAAGFVHTCLKRLRNMGLVEAHKTAPDADLVDATWEPTDLGLRAAALRGKRAP